MSTQHIKMLGYLLRLFKSQQSGPVYKNNMNIMGYVIHILYDKGLNAGNPTSIDAPVKWETLYRLLGKNLWETNLTKYVHQHTSFYYAVVLFWGYCMSDEMQTQISPSLVSD